MPDVDNFVRTLLLFAQEIDDGDVHSVNFDSPNNDSSTRMLCIRDSPFTITLFYEDITDDRDSSRILAGRLREFLNEVNLEFARIYMDVVKEYESGDTEVSRESQLQYKSAFDLALSQIERTLLSVPGLPM